MKRLVTALSLLPIPALADSPVVIADTPIMHSLATRIAQGTGIQPELLLNGDFSAHHGALRPSQARSLASADLVFWTGADLTPWLSPALASLSPEARAIELLASEGWTPLAGAPHVHDEDHEDHDAHEDEAGHDDHDAHDAHDDHDEHEDHGEHDTHDEHDDHDAHDNDHADAHADEANAEEAIDPHAWLDPAVALAWAGTIADEMSRIAPEEAPAFAANLDAFGTEIAALSTEIKDILAPHQGSGYVVAHDAYGYFARSFDMAPRGSILPPGAHDVGPRQLAEIRDVVAEEGIGCILSDIETPAETVELVASANAARIVVTDPEGRDPEAGPGLYAATLRGLAVDLADCLTEN